MIKILDVIISAAYIRYARLMATDRERVLLIVSIGTEDKDVVVIPCTNREIGEQLLDDMNQQLNEWYSEP